jgi:hypothetical protein
LNLLLRKSLYLLQVEVDFSPSGLRFSLTNGLSKAKQFRVKAKQFRASNG